MPSFTLYDLNPEFWSKVKAKAAAEGTTVKAVILRLLTAWLAAVAILSVTGCGYKNPIAPTPAAVVPAVSSAPASIQILGASRKDNLVDVVARVLTSDGRAVADVEVTFTTSTGSLAPGVAMTEADGRAHSVLTSFTMSTVTATAGRLAVEAKFGSSLSEPIPPTTGIPIPIPPPPPPIPPSPPRPGSYSVSLTASPASVVVGGSTTLRAAVARTDDAPEPSAYVWDCGNGTGATTTSAGTVCTYATVNTYTARVTVTGGTVTGGSTTSVTVTPVPPPAMTVSLTSNAASVTVGGMLTFTATVLNLSAGETITAIQWDIDGAAGYEATTAPVPPTTTDARTSLPYTADGIFTAKVLATTSTGRTATGTVGFVVTN